MNEAVMRIMAGSETQSRQLWEDLEQLIGLSDEAFASEVTTVARDITRRTFGNRIAVSGLVAFSSNCSHDCLYCGLRRSNREVPRYRLLTDQIHDAIRMVADSGLTRLFLVSGEDTGYLADDIIPLIEYTKSFGLHLSLALGERTGTEIDDFRKAGTNCYALKFETSNNTLFNRMKPTTTFDRRMAAIWHIRHAGLELGSGNIVGLEGETNDDIVSDLMLMHELAIDWAPVVPFLPAPGTPLGESAPPGDVELTLRVLSLVRLMLPHCMITASQPSRENPRSFGDPGGNRDALDAGANLLFVDMTPRAVRRDFRITPGRVLPELQMVDTLLESMGLSRD